MSLAASHNTLQRKMSLSNDEIYKPKDKSDRYRKQLEVEIMRREEAETEADILNQRLQVLQEECRRAKEALQSRVIVEDSRIAVLEAQLEQARLDADDSAHKYREITRKLTTAEPDVEYLASSERNSVGPVEAKFIQFEQKLSAVSQKMILLEAAEEKAAQREEAHELRLNRLNNLLKEAELRAEFAEHSVKNLLKEVNRLEDDLTTEREKNALLQKQVSAIDYNTTNT